MTNPDRIGTEDRDQWEKGERKIRSLKSEVGGMKGKPMFT
jgi:hypothetical protein